MRWGKTGVITIVMTGGKQFAWPPRKSMTDEVVGSFELGKIQFATVLFINCAHPKTLNTAGGHRIRSFSAATEVIFPSG